MHRLAFASMSVDLRRWRRNDPCCETVVQPEVQDLDSWAIVAGSSSGAARTSCWRIDLSLVVFLQRCPDEKSYQMIICILLFTFIISILLV